jgi:hypothetical protein
MKGLVSIAAREERGDCRKEHGNAGKKRTAPAGREARLKPFLRIKASLVSASLHLPGKNQRVSRIAEPAISHRLANQTGRAESKFRHKSCEEQVMSSRNSLLVAPARIPPPRLTATPRAGDMGTSTRWSCGRIGALGGTDPHWRRKVGPSARDPLGGIRQIERIRLLR